MKKVFLFIAVAMTVLLSSCSENYSNGERIGMVTQFSNSGLLCKTWEGHLNTTQTGMNTSVPFDFSIDRDATDQKVVNALDSAAQYGWKVKLVYHETFGWNWFSNRGDTNHFITKCEVLDKTPMKNVFGNKADNKNGHVIDTIYVVIDKSQLKRK